MHTGQKNRKTVYPESSLPIGQKNRKTVYAVDVFWN